MKQTKSAQGNKVHSQQIHVYIAVTQISKVNLINNKRQNYSPMSTSLSGLNSFGESANAVPIRRRGVGVGFPAILGMSAGIMPVMSYVIHTDRLSLASLL